MFVTSRQVHENLAESLSFESSAVLLSSKGITSQTGRGEFHSRAMLCSIFLLEGDALHLQYAAALSLPEAYRAAIAIAAPSSKEKICRWSA
jgi:hypothetical protein